MITLELRKRLEVLLEQAMQENRVHAVDCLLTALAELAEEEIVYIDTGSSRLEVVCSAADKEFVASTLKCALGAEQSPFGRARLH